MDEIKKNGNWLRAQLLILAFGKGKLLELIHESKLPKDSKGLCTFLNENKSKIISSLDRENVDKIFSSNNGKHIYSLLFNVSTCHQLICCFELISPCYVVKPKPHIINKGSYIWKLADLQKQLDQSLDVSDEHFQKICRELEVILSGLNCFKMLSEFKGISFEDCCKAIHMQVYKYETLRNAVNVKIKSLQNSDNDSQIELYTNFQTELEAKFKKLIKPSGSINDTKEVKESIDSKPISGSATAVDNEVGNAPCEKGIKAEIVGHEKGNNIENIPIVMRNPTAASRRKVTEPLSVCGLAETLPSTLSGPPEMEREKEQLRREQALEKKLPSIPLDSPELERKKERLRFGLTVKENMTFAVIRNLSLCLDEITGSSFSKLAISIGFEEDKVKQLYLSYAGGGIPALQFFRHLCITKAKTPVSDLVRFLEQEEMPEDCVDIIKDYRQKHLGDITAQVLNRLAIALTQNEVGNVHVKDWRIIASDFYYSPDIIDAIATTVRQGATFSPTEQLFRLIRTQKPSYQLIKIVKYLEDIKNEVAAQILNTFIEETVQKQLDKDKA